MNTRRFQEMPAQNFAGDRSYPFRFDAGAPGRAG